MLESIKKVDKKVLIMGGLVFGILFLLIIIILISSLLGGGKLSYEKIEKKLAGAAEKYYKDNDSSLPKNVGETVEVDASTLVSGGYIKDLSEYTDENVSCSAKVIVGKNDSEKGYDYVANLDCGEEYKTEFLADKLIKDIVSSGNGLYKMEDVVVAGETLGTDDDGYDLSSNELMKGYIYRGEKVNNYIKIGGELFRIVKIDGNKDFTLVTTYKKEKGPFDNRYNSEIEKNYGINDYSLSRAYESISSRYEKLDEKIKQKIAVKNICIGARSSDETVTDGSIECSKLMKNQHYGLLSMYDVMNASLAEKCETSVSRECVNYNYLLGETTFWTMTPDTENTYFAYRVSDSISASRANMNATYKYVVYLSNRLVYESGTGTESDPYIVK